MLKGPTMVSTYIYPEISFFPLLAEEHWFVSALLKGSLLLFFKGVAK